MNKVSGFVTFLAGAVIGSFVAWQYVKNKYEQLAQAEIDSVKETFSAMEEKEFGTREDSMPTHQEIKQKTEERKTYRDLVKQEGYTDYSRTTKEGKEEPMGNERPYVIAPEEFGEFEDYERISLTYYADQILADENDEMVEDVDETVGVESLTHFGEYEDDSVFVRNDRLKCDYEILLDQRTYAEIMEHSPHRIGAE